MKTMMDTWTKEYTRVIDQRPRRLPPTWVLRERMRDGEAERGAYPATVAPVGVSRKGTRDRTREQGRAVHVSGPERAVAKRILELLATAKRMVVVFSFLLADREIEDAILEAARRGVRVYALLASEARLDREPGDGEFERRVLAEHQDMLQRLGGYVLIRSAPHFHAKLVLVDPHASPAGLLLTANLTREALERNEELAVELTPQDVAEAAEVIRWALWERAEHELVEPGNFRAVKPLGCIEHPAPVPHVLATTASVTQIREEAVEIIEDASRELVVASFGWDAGHPVIEHLCARAREGLSLTVLARVRPRAMPALVALAKAGARVLGFKWLHAKALWADSGRALIMSANLEKHGLDGGFELGVRLDGERAEELRRRLERWSDQAAWELRPAPALGEVAGSVRVWHGPGICRARREASATGRSRCLHGGIRGRADCAGGARGSGRRWTSTARPRRPRTRVSVARSATAAGSEGQGDQAARHAVAEGYRRRGHSGYGIEDEGRLPARRRQEGQADSVQASRVQGAGRKAGRGGPIPGGDPGCSPAR